MLEVFRDLQDEGICFVNVVPPHGADANHPDTIVNPAMPVTDLKLFLGSDTTPDFDCASVLLAAIKGLTAGQIRALGTHDTAIKNREWILWEFKHIINDSHLYNTRQRVQLRNLSDEYIYQDMLEYFDEATRKSITNRRDYEDGRRHLVNETRHHTVMSEAVTILHEAAEDIWAKERVDDLARAAGRGKSLAQYLGALQKANSGKLGGQAVKTLAQDHLRHCNQPLPESLQEAMSEAGGPRIINELNGLETVLRSQCGY